MTDQHRRWRRPWASALLLVTLAACVDQPPAAPSSAISLDIESPCTPREGELFGKVFLNGIPTTRTDLNVVLTPADPETQARLKGPYSSTMWVSPGAPSHVYPAGSGFAWYDPRAGCECGGLASYLAGDTTARIREQHWVSATEPDTAHYERHCVMPGRYQISLGDQSFRLEYVGASARIPGTTSAVKVLDTGLGDSLLVEPRTYDPYDTYSDHMVHFDLRLPARATTALAVLRLQAVYSDQDTSAFVAEGGEPGITDTNYVRFSTRQRSGLNWPHSPGTAGRALTHFTWDLGGLGAPLAHFSDDSNMVPLLRVHRFSHVLESRPVIVGVRLKEPDNDPDDSTLVTTRTLHLTRVTPVPPTACASFEGTATWRTTDQALNAACSTRGPDLQYRWRFDTGADWTSYTTDTLYDFPGHSVSGSHQVTVEARNVVTGLSAQQPYSLSVTASQIVLSGPIYVTDKATKTYTSNLSAWWFERWNPDLHWYHASAEARTWLGRIWYAGDYTVELRQQDSTPSLLRRGRLHITRCYYDLGPCEGGNLHASRTMPSPSVETWGVFGGGPWLSWGPASAPRALRFYDLLGMHDLPTAFTAPTWLDATAPETVTGAAWDVTWTRHPLDLPDVRAFEFAVTRTEALAPFVFGIALDPDLGADAADDVAGYDTSRGLAWVQDGQRAVGYLLRDATGSNAIASLQQFGLRRWAPRLPAEAWTAQRTPGVRLLHGPGDVQLLLSTAERPTTGAWTLVVLRAADLSTLRVRADAVLAALADQ